MYRVVLVIAFALTIVTPNVFCGEKATTQKIEATQHHGEQPAFSGARTEIKSQLDLVTRESLKIIREFAIIIFGGVVVALIKMILLKQSIHEIIACGLESTAFLFLHAIEIVRYVAIALKRLARELRQRSRGSRLCEPNVNAHGEEEGTN